METRRQGITESYEVKLIRKDGSPYWAIISVKPLFDINGEFKGTLSMLTDITERKRIEDALKKSEQHLNDLISSIKDGFFELDQRWRFTFINQRAAQNVGFEPEELIGECVWEKTPFVVNSKYEAVFREVMETRLPASFEIKSLTRDQWYGINVYPSLSGISVFWTEITERKQVERALQEAYEELQAQSEELHKAYKLLHESENKFRTLAENSPDLIVRFDRQNRHIYANPAAVEFYGHVSRRHHW